MTFLFGDGFDHYTSSTSIVVNAAMRLKWDLVFESGTNSTVGTSFGRFGSGGYAIVNIHNYSKKVLSVNASTLIAGAGVTYTAAATYALHRLFSFWDGATEQISIRRDINQKIAAYRGATLLGTSTTTFPAGQFRHLEAKVVFHASTGSVTVRMDETAILTLTGINTLSSANAYANVVYLGGVGDSVDSTVQGAGQFDDFWICDDQGSVNNDFLGDIRAETIFATGAGNSTQFTRNTGASNQAAINEVAVDSDTTYNYSATVSNKDTFVFGDLTSTTGTIKAVQTNLFARKDDSNVRQINAVYRLSSTNYTGTATTLPSTYAYIIEVKETSPDTSIAWTITEVNGAEFGYNVAS